MAPANGAASDARTCRPRPATAGGWTRTAGRTGGRPPAEVTKMARKISERWKPPTAHKRQEKRKATYLELCLAEEVVEEVPAHTHHGVPGQGLQNAKKHHGEGKCFFSRIELYILTFLSFSAACSASANLLFSSSQATLSSGSRGRATTTSRGATTWTEKKGKEQ